MYLPVRVSHGTLWHTVWFMQSEVNLGETLFQLTSGMLSPLRLHNVRATIVICLTWLATPWRLLRALGKSNHTIKTKVVSSIGTGLQHFPHCKTSER